MKKERVIGVISDTHGLLRPEVLELFNDVGLILHAGDIGSPEVLRGLETRAPVLAVRGNNDTEPWAKRIPEHRLLREDGVAIYLLHNVKEMRPATCEKAQVVISGHSHKPGVEWREGVLYLNPGSAGPRRFKLPIAVARLFLRGAAARAELIEL